MPAVETRQPAQNRISTAEITRSRSAEDLETLYHELYGDELGFFKSNLWGKDDDNDVQGSGSCHAGREGNAQSPGEETRLRREQVDRVFMEISNEQLRDDGFQIFSFEDGTVFAEIHYNNNNNVSENYLSLIGYRAISLKAACKAESSLIKIAFSAAPAVFTCKR